MENNPTNQNSSDDKEKSKLGIIVHSFFIVPFLIAICCVLVFLSVRILTMENRTVHDYLSDIRDGGSSKRWQAAFELSKLLANEKVDLKNERFLSGMTDLFERSTHDDVRVRQYLALAMGRSGSPAFLKPLLTSLKEEKNEDAIPSQIQALGLLGSGEAITTILPYLAHASSNIRLTAVIALGNIKDVSTIPQLQKHLGDEEVNVQWDAAIALAKMGNSGGREKLLQLLDRDFLSQFKEIDRREQIQVLLVAIRAAALLKDSELNQAIKKLGDSDKNMEVRRVALEVLG